MRVTLSLAAICAMLAVIPASAHHSHGNYADTFMDVEGVVKEVHFIVPHSWVYIEVKNPAGGEPQRAGVCGIHRYSRAGGRR